MAMSLLAYLTVIRIDHIHNLMVKPLTNMEMVSLGWSLLLWILSVHK